jgi:hypothetical protein
MRLGSEDHKLLFCRSFLDSYLDYEPENLPWPNLKGQDLEKLRSIPFWREALVTEQGAGAMVTAFAQTQTDPWLRQAIALQGQEEQRHARLVAFLIEHYGIEIPPVPETPVPAQVETAFIDFGFEECLDSFFAFGMFGIARQAQYLPEAMFQIFDPILDEEARHIVFFINWLTYLQCQQGRPNWLRGMNSLWHYGRALNNLANTFGGAATAEESTSFTVTEARHFMDDLTPELFFEVCLRENHQRMARFAPQLLQPRLLPRLSQMALSVLRRFKKRPALTVAQKS